MDFLEVKSRKRKRRISDNRTQLPSNIQIVIKNLFEKKFRYENQEEYTLKGSYDGKMCEEWKIQDFISMKNELNTLKNELNDKDMITWHEHTRLVNLAGNIAPEIRNQLRPELCTQAWCKFYEIASTYLNVADKESLVTVHLCEAPGAFVTSLNHFLFTQDYAGDWMWFGTTLNPYYEGNNIGQMIDEDIFIRSSYGNWYFGEDNTGDLMSAVNLKGLQEKLSNMEVDLVTADGSIDCQGDPAEQENVVSRLQHCEVLTALHILSPGGTLVVKMFTLFECKAIGLMFLLNCVFEKVEVFKPCTSKGGNSEVYVIGLKFKGRQCCESFLQKVTPAYFGDSVPPGCLFSQEDIPKSFLEQHSHCIQFFKDCQMSTIQRNLDLLKVMTDDERSKVEDQKDFCMECFFNRYDIKPMQYGARLMKISRRKKQAPRTTEFSAKVKLEGKFTGSFCERQELSTLPWRQKVSKIETYEDEVNRPDNSLWIQCQHEKISDKDIDMWQILKGKQVNSIQSSRFCHGFYLHRTQELIQNSKWLAEQTERDTDFVMNVAAKLKEILCDTIQYYKGGPITQPDHQLTKLCDDNTVNVTLTESVNYSKNEVGETIVDTDIDKVIKANGEFTNGNESVNNCENQSEVDETIVDIDVDNVTEAVGNYTGLGAETRDHEDIDNVDTGKANDMDAEKGDTSEMSITNTTVGNMNKDTDGDSSEMSIANVDVSDMKNDTVGSTSEMNILSASVGGMNKDNDNVGIDTPIDGGKSEVFSVTSVVPRDNTEQIDDTGQIDMDGGTDVRIVSKLCGNGCNVENVGEKGDNTSTNEKDSLKADKVDVDNKEVSMGEATVRFTCACIKGDSPVLEELSKQGSDGGVMVRLYSAGSTCRKVCQRFELSEKKDLLTTVQDILKTCKTSDYVIIEMGSCLSRFTAGLIYILYRSFKEIGFVHHHGNLMRRHLVCINFQHCPMKLGQFVEEVCHMTESGQSELLLEVVPVLTILEDEDFTSFLRISNVNILQSFITTVVCAEKKEYCLDNT